MIQYNSLEEVKALAMKKRSFFIELVKNVDSQAKLDKVLEGEEMTISAEDKATLYLLIKFGTSQVTAKQLLTPIKDVEVRGVWVS